MRYGEWPTPHKPEVPGEPDYIDMIGTPGWNKDRTPAHGPKATETGSSAQDNSQPLEDLPLAA